MMGQAVMKVLLLSLAGIFLSGCSIGGTAPPDRATLPLLTAWYDGKLVYYITTDVSERKIAEKMGANLAPRLTDGLPDYPKPPGQKTILEKVYDFTNSPQNKVFSSAPEPIGPASRDRHYSPVWLAILVTWQADHKIRTLTSEEAILDAAEKGEISLVTSDILLNCPIVGSAEGKTLPNVTLHSH